MDTGPTPITPGCAGTPLSHQATESRRNATGEVASVRAKPDDTISDTLETTDRESDGRQPMIRHENPPRDHDRPDQGSLLDLSG